MQKSLKNSEIERKSRSFSLYAKYKVIYKEILVQIMMIEHSFFARSNAILSDRQYHLRRFSENSARSRWSSKQILFDHMCFCLNIWSRIDLINDPAYLITFWCNFSQIVFMVITLGVGQICPSLSSNMVKKGEFLK